MNDTDLRDTLSLVSDAVPVPAPDVSAFDARVRGVRRRRTTGRAATATVAVAGLAVGATLALGGSDGTRTTPPVADPPAQVRAGTPVLVDGRLASVAQDGTLSAPGPKVARLVGSTGDGVVVFAMDGSLARVTAAGEVVTIVDEPVRTAYLADGGVAYQTYDNLVHWQDTALTQDSARSDGRLMAAGSRIFVIGTDRGLVGHDKTGLFDLPLAGEEPDETASEVEVGGGLVAVHTRAAVSFFEDRGLRETGMAGLSTGALSPDGKVYAASDRGLQLVDPHTGDVTGVSAGPSGPALDLAWTDADTLLVLEGDDQARTLWRCTDGGTACTVLLDDATGTLRLR